MKRCALPAKGLSRSRDRGDYPYTGEVIATVPKANIEDVRRALRIAHQYRSTLTRYDRYRILMRAGEIIAQRKEEIATLITLESGLSLKDTLYEVGRASDVLLFAANQALVDDGQVFSCDLTPHGKSRKVYTLKEPLLGAISAITPFNHPLNQVIHKVRRRWPPTTAWSSSRARRRRWPPSRWPTSSMRPACRHRCCRSSQATPARLPTSF